MVWGVIYGGLGLLGLSVVWRMVVLVVYDVVWDFGMLYRWLGGLGYDMCWFWNL